MPKDNSQITVREVPDFLTEQRMIKEEKCTFTFVDRTPVLYVSTKIDDYEKLSQLPGWEVILPAGSNSLKRFCVKISKEALRTHLRAIYGNERLIWIPLVP